MEEELETIKAIFMDDVTIEENGAGGRQMLNLAVDGHRVLTLRITGKLHQLLHSRDEVAG